MNIKQLRLLADNGKPLVLTTTAWAGALWITRDEEVPVEYSRDMGGAHESLEQALAHYPRRVTINGRKLETTPAPTSASVKVLEAPGYSTGRQHYHPFRPSVSPESEPLGGRYNALVGGVCCRIDVTITSGERSESVYLSPQVGEHSPHHRPLMGVSLEAHTVVQTKEIQQMRGEWGAMATIPTHTSLHERAADRRREMREHTEKLAGMPPRHEGPVYVNVTIGESGESEIYQGVPMQVMGRPVGIDQTQANLMDDELLSLTDALHQGDSEYVPVSERATVMLGRPISGSKPDLQVTEVRVETGQGEEHPTMVDRITFHLSMLDHCRGDGEPTTLAVPGRIHMQGDYEDEIRCIVVRGTIEHPELRDILTRAYWKSEEWNSTGEMEYQLECMEKRMGHMATHILGDPETAMLDEMQDRVDRIFPNVPVPAARLSATSQDGRWTLTLNQNRTVEPAELAGAGAGSC